MVGVESTVAALDLTFALLAARAPGAQVTVRFTRASRAYLAPQYGRTTCAIEVAVPPEETSVLPLVERALIDPKIGGRPHWGMPHTIASGFLDHYPKSARWRAVHRRLGGPFESAFTRRQDGTGLGLPLTKALTERHGGRLTITSEPGSGTRVEVRLPAVQRPDTQAGAPLDLAAASRA